jgi:hypothetical protein
MKKARTIDPLKDQSTKPQTHRKPDMKLALTLLLIGTSLGTGPAAFAADQSLPLAPRAVLYPGAEPGPMQTLIDADKDDDDEGGWFWPKSDDDDDEDDEDDDCEEDDDEDDCEAGAVGNTAKPGTVAPPKNGLFTDGTAPVVKSN